MLISGVRNAIANTNLFAEIIEDIALERAIKECEDTETVSREAIFNILKNQR